MANSRSTWSANQSKGYPGPQVTRPRDYRINWRQIQVCSIVPICRMLSIWRERKRRFFCKPNGKCPIGKHSNASSKYITILIRSFVQLSSVSCSFQAWLYIRIAWHLASTKRFWNGWFREMPRHKNTVKAHQIASRQANWRPTPMLYVS